MLRPTAAAISARPAPWVALALLSCWAAPAAGLKVADAPADATATARAAPPSARPVVGPAVAPLPSRSATNLAVQPERLDKATRESLHARYGRVLAKELGLLQALDRLDRDAVEADKRLARLALERADATTALRKAETLRAGAERRLAEMRTAVRARLRALLRLRRVPALRFVLSAEDFARSVVKDRLLERLVEGDRARLARYRAQVARLAKDTRSRDAELARLKRLDTALHDEKAKLERQRHDKQALLTQIEVDPIYNDGARRDMDAANRALVERVRTLKEWQQRRFTFGRVKGKLLPPLGRYTLEVPFGPRRHPSFGTTTWHRGVDFRVPGRGTAPVRAVFWGRVAHVGWLTGYGTTVIIDHGKGWHTVYAHLDRVSVELDQVVRSRQQIAMVGASGSLKGRYLYFEIRENGRAQNPQHWFR